MNKIDASVASQSETSRHSEVKASSEGFVSKNFDPFFDFVTQFVHPHFIFYLVYVIMITIQVIYVSMWMHDTTFWVFINDDKQTHSFSKLAQIIHYIAPLSAVYKTADDYLLPFIIYTVIVLILIISIIFQLLFYKTQRRFSKITLYPTRIFIEMVIPMMLIPLAHFTGHSFAYLFKTSSKKEIEMYVFFVIGLIEYLACIVIFYYSASIMGVSAYLSVSPISCFDNRPLIHLILCSSFFTIFETCFLIFPSWVIHPFIVFHILISVYIGYELIFQPFISAKWNCYFFAIDIFAITLDVLYLISNFFDFIEIFKDKKDGNTTILIINLVCFFGLFIGSIIGATIFSYNRFKKMKKSLTDFQDDIKINEVTLSEEEKNDVFYKLKLDRSESRALSVLYFVIQNNIVPYLDYILIKFILNAHKSPHALMQCMRSISYFPANSRYLNMLFNIFANRRDVRFTHRFFIYQIQKIKMLRQSSSSLIACEKLHELNTRTKELEEDVINFWLINPNKESKDRCKAVNDHGVDVSYLYQLQDRVDKTRALWEEALIDFPNSIPYRVDFCHFAVECQTDFAHAIKSKHKSDLIESGRNFNVDMAFRLFVKNFPNYLKKGIIDTKGNLIRASKKQVSGNLSHSSANSSKNQSLTTASSTSMLNGQIEEEIGRTLITQSRIRLALQHSTQKKKADRFPLLIFVTLFLFVLGLAFALFIFIYFKNYFDERSRSMIRIEMVNKIQLFTYASALMMFYKWGNLTDQIHIDEFVHVLEDKDRIHDPAFLKSKYYDENLVYFNIQARDVFRDFLIDISELSGEGVNVFKYGKPLFEGTTQLYFCNETHVISPYLTNLKTALLFIFMSESQIANLNNITLLEEMFKNNIDYCHIIQNLMYIYAPFQEVRELLIEMSENDSHKDSTEIYRIKLALSIIYAIITVCLSCTFYFLYIREIMNFVELLLKLPADAKMNAMKPIRKNTGDNHNTDKNENEETDLSMNIHHDEPDMKGKYSIPLVFCIIIFICFMCNIILTFFQLENIETYNEKFYFLSNWVLLGRYRKVLIIRLTDWIMHLIMSDNPMINGSHYINKSAFPDLISRNFAELNSATTRMLEGHDGIPGSNNQDDEIDVLTYQESCETNQSDPSYHELYQCGSLRNILIFFTNGINEMIVNAEEYHNKIDFRVDEVSAQLLHLVTNHALPRLNKIDERWDAVRERYYNSFSQSHTIYMCCSLIIVLIAFLLMIRLTMILSSAYRVCLLLLRRVSPIAIVNDPPLLAYLLDKTEEKNSNNSSTDQGIIKNSQDAIICLSSSGMIDMVNPSVNRLFGFTPEQLLGQPIATSLFDEKNGSHVTNQIYLMLNKQSPLYFEDHVTCITDDDTEVPCQIMIFGMTSDNELDGTIEEDSDSEDDEEKKKKKRNSKSGDIESFVVILRDETEMIKHQQIAEEAKKQSETLLYQILPRSIVIRLNQGEKDISFSVPSATIMFIDIAKFSDYAATLTPQEIMGNLSAIMGGYDDAIAKYDMLLKIKLIGDVYMCAGGLFNTDDPPASHAEQMIRFGLDALQNIEDMNVKLSALLSVRIGVNTGGPLIAGVLGTDKPTFDIIGDPINIASRLQSTDFPGRIQISQQTYELVKDLDFQIESRGEVFLKGKGNQPAYVVSPQSGISFSLSQMGENESNSFNKSGSGQ